MSDVADLLKALEREAGDPTCWLALADALEESGEGERAELMRLTTLLRTSQMGRKRRAGVKRVCELLLAGVKPCVPELVNSIGMRFVLIPPGWSSMGSAGREANPDERPVRRVEITRAFWLGACAVTQGEFTQVMKDNPSWFQPGKRGARSVARVNHLDLPVESVSWDQAARFCQRLSRRAAEKKAGRVYRLPTEAEWEYACRGGAFSTTTFHLGNTLEPDHANFSLTKLNRTSAGGAFPPNVFGVYDMHGNVWEWCNDWYNPRYYGTRPKEDRDPPGPKTGAQRVMRGGSFRGVSGRYCRTAYRYGTSPQVTHDYLGFRVALDVPPGPGTEE